MIHKQHNNKNNFLYIQDVSNVHTHIKIILYLRKILHNNYIHHKKNLFTKYFHNIPILYFFFSIYSNYTIFFFARSISIYIYLPVLLNTQIFHKYFLTIYTSSFLPQILYTSTENYSNHNI
jgi:hypothetical protein